MATTDIIDLIQRDHDELRALLGRIDDCSPAEREDLFREIVAELARHEAAEEAIVHPTLRDETPGGQDVAEEVLEQESEAEQLLADMEKMDATSGEFLAKFRKLRDEVLEHAEKEEQEEHPRLRATLEEQRLAEMAEGWQKVKEQGPTHPHPKTPQKPEIRAAAGPVAGMFDRARDKARELMSS